MTAMGYGPGYVWGLILLIGIGTFGIRFVLIPLITRIELSARVETALGLIPAAVLAALVVPNIIVLNGSPGGVFLAPRFVAGSAAFVVAYRTEHMLATIGVGMLVLWGAQFIFG